MVSLSIAGERLKLIIFHLPGGEGYVEDGREIFDDGEEDYEVQSSSNKRKSQQKKRGKLPDEPVTKKKSLKNFFGKQDKKEKETASVEDDDLLKNILGDLSTDAGCSSSTSASLSVAPRPMKSLKKKATESEIEMKNYMEQMGKSAKKSQADVSHVLSAGLFSYLCNFL
jgi:predicted AAA+ superfamily ATPase